MRRRLTQSLALVWEWGNRMRYRALALVLGMFVANAGAAEGGPTLLTASRIHTMDVATPVATAMAYDADGRILALGNVETLARRYPDATRIDAGNATVIPGLIDAHGHLGDLGETQLIADLVGADSKAEVLDRLRAFASKNPGEGWLLGNGWDQNDWDEKQFPSAADLDALFPQRPVWLLRVDGHAGWANTAALRAIGRDLSGDWHDHGFETA